MTDSFSLPEAFFASCLDDSLLAEAYDALDAQQRAVLKANIAALYAIWREQRESTSLTRCLPEGYTVRQESAPAPYALVVCDAAYPSPACFLAAAMPALLAGVGLVIPCFVGNAGRPLAPLVAATELAGLEDALALPETTELLPLVQALHAQGAGGRLVVLGRGPLAREALSYALDQGIPCLSLTRPPYFHPVNRKDGHLAPVEAVLHAAPGASGQTCAAGACPRHVAPPDALWPVFSWTEQAGIPTAAPCDVALEDSLANLWVWPGLDPAWFMNRRLCISAGIPARHLF